MDFAIETNIPNSSSVVFRLIKRIEGDLTWLSELKSWPDDKINAAFDYSMSLVGGGPSSATAAVAAAKVMHFIHLHRPDDARRTLTAFLNSGFTMDSEFAACDRLLAPSA